MGKVRKALLTMTALTAAAGGAYFYASKTPAFAIREAARAVKACDFGRLERVVSVSDVTGSVIDEALADPELIEKFGEGTTGKIGMLLTQGFAGLMKPVISGVVTASLEDYVESCKLFQPLTGAFEKLAPLAEALREPLGPELIALTAFQHLTQDAGKLATISVPVKNGTLVVQLLETDGKWRIMRIPGALGLAARQ